MSYLYNRLVLFKQPAFLCYTLTCLLTTFGAGISFIAVPWIILQYHNNVTAMAIALALFWLPNILLAPLAGVIIDRYPRVLVVIVSNAIRIVCLLILAFTSTSHVVTSLYTLCIVSGIGLSFYIPAAMTLVREIVDKEALLYANTSVDMAYEVGNVAGMACGGILLAIVSVKTLFLINAGMFITACILLCSLPRHLFQRKHNNIPLLRFIDDLQQGLAYLHNNKELVVLYTIQCLMMLQYMVAPMLLGPYAKNVLHATSRQFGYIEASLSLGVVTGGFIVPWLKERIGFYRCIQILVIFLGLLYIWFANNHEIVWATVDYFLVGLALSTWPLLVTRAQHATDLDFQGRVQSVFMCIVGTCLLTTYTLLAFTGSWLSVSWLYWLLVVLSAVIVIMMWQARRRGYLTKFDEVTH